MLLRYARDTAACVVIDEVRRKMRGRRRGEARLFTRFMRMARRYACARRALLRMAVLRWQQRQSRAASLIRASILRAFRLPRCAMLMVFFAAGESQFFFQFFACLRLISRRGFHMAFAAPPPRQLMLYRARVLPRGAFLRAYGICASALA